MAHLNFSVIVPTYNRPEALAACLDSFLRLDYPDGAWELIVVNDGGTLSFTAVSDTHKNNLPLILITTSNGGPAAARNAGSRVAKGDYLAFTDDDCRVAPNWLTKLVQGFEQTDCDAIAGVTLNPQPGNPGMDASQFLVDFLYQFFQDQAGNTLLLVSNNVAYRRQIFESINGFNEDFPPGGGGRYGT